MNKQVAIGILTVAIITIGIAGFAFSKGFGQSQNMTPSINKVVEVQPTITEVTTKDMSLTSTPASPSIRSYKDGMYTVSGAYESPAGIEDMSVSITIKAGKIETTEITPKANDSKSLRYQEAFVGAYKPLIIGKSIDDARLDTVSGASLTTIGFNDAIDKIKAQAKG